MTRNLPWMALNPELADYGATEGAYVNGFTLLKVSDNTFTVTGVCSCSTKEDAERMANKNDQRDVDRRIARKVLLSWAL